MTDDLTEIPLSPDATRPDKRRGKLPVAFSRENWRTVKSQARLRNYHFDAPKLDDFGKGETK